MALSLDIRAESQPRDVVLLLGYTVYKYRIRCHNSRLILGLNRHSPTDLSSFDTSAIMFNENFSFVSGTSDPRSANAHSTDISPFTSRCSSPKHMEFVEGYHGRQFRDTRYDSYRPRHPSVSALTAQLESHALSERRQPSYTSECDNASPEPPVDDEGYYEGPDTPATTDSDYSADFDPSLYDLSMSDMSATSSPRPSLSLEAQAHSSYTRRRHQRQALIRLQCMAKRTPDLAMLLEECHPSSLPLPSDAIWNPSRSGSVTNISSGRIEKERKTSTSVRKTPRARRDRKS